MLGWGDRTRGLPPFLGQLRELSSLVRLEMGAPRVDKPPGSGGRGLDGRNLPHLPAASLRAKLRAESQNLLSALPLSLLCGTTGKRQPAPPHPKPEHWGGRGHGPSRGLLPWPPLLHVFLGYLLALLPPYDGQSSDLPFCHMLVRLHQALHPAIHQPGLPVACPCHWLTW